MQQCGVTAMLCACGAAVRPVLHLPTYCCTFVQPGVRPRARSPPLQSTAVLVVQLRRSLAAYGMAHVAAGARGDGGGGPGQEDGDGWQQQQRQREGQGEAGAGWGEWDRGAAGGPGGASGPLVATSWQRLREVVAELNQVRGLVQHSNVWICTARFAAHTALRCCSDGVEAWQLVR